jgi:hypothetical protein
MPWLVCWHRLILNGRNISIIPFKKFTKHFYGLWAQDDNYEQKDDDVLSL